MNELKNTVDRAQLRYEKIPTYVFSEADEASIVVAREIASLVKLRQQENKTCVLGFPTGSTPVGVFDELVRMHREEGLSFKNVVSFNTDEYYPIHPEEKQSLTRYMWEHLFDHIDIREENINIPDGMLPMDEVAEFCTNYEQKITGLGGIDIQILGIGPTGHIGFNEPGSFKGSVTRMITLDTLTRGAVASDFFGLESVPRKAITVGIETILKAHKIILLAWGEGKSKLIRETVEGEITEMIPASFIQEHPQAMVVVDEGAAEELTRQRTPWLITSCDWGEKMIRKAVVRLCITVGKPILKLTDRDYNDNGLSDLVAEHGPAYNINIKVFNDLQHTITGWPGGKPHADDSDRPERAKPFPKRSIIFSPHPDDDVISMGGTFIRLVDQGNDVHVAYQTSGNIAVFDADVIRFADFAADYQKLFTPGNSGFKELFNKIHDSQKNKKAGDIDMAEVRRLKGLIRKGEAKAACRYIGIPDENVHFLDLPFYETGAVKKKPIGKEDVDIIVKLLKKIRPHQVFAAGDLSDPHGTHRVCLDAIFRAFDLVRDDDWVRDCYVWLYRGAWQEWKLSEVEMAVPLSPDEVNRKRMSIFKHQSQKDSVLFPGSDVREFWQRAEDRNHATAVLYDKLGMAEYQAFEAFVRYLPASWK
ncbi:MAG: glucosamine-6-phosphate deaminase [Bacteroidota bacterium]|nr:glucosamine-6-phosphate deaminase [Bacteroidota bacterium]